MQVFKIIFQHWFSIDLSFQLPESKDEDENEDTSSIELDPNVKCKGQKPSLQGELIDLNNPPKML